MRPPTLLLLALALTAAAQESPTFRADLNQVFVTFSATDPNGLPVLDLNVEELQLKDEKRPRAIQYFARDVDVPLTIGLVVDTSGSQVRFIKRYRQQLETFLRQVIRPGDQAFLVGFANQVRLVTDLTGSVEALLAGVDVLDTRDPGEPLGEQCGLNVGNVLRGGCSSAIWDAMYSSARLRAREATGRKALILFSDGMDTGSRRSLKDVIEAAQSADASVYTLTSQDALFSWMGPSAILRSSSGRGSMKRVAEETGGRNFKANEDEIPGIFSQIETDLRSFYIAGFTVPDGDRDGKFHKLELKATRPNVKIRARKGYTAQR